MPDRPAIAVVGAGCRYPDAADPDGLWELVLGQRRAFRPIPAIRLNLDDYGMPAGRAAPDSTSARLAAVLEGWRFDRAGFRIPGATYRVTDPTHWLALDVAAQTLESAGFPGAAGLDRDRVGVVIGNTLAGEFSRASLVRLRWPYVRRVLGAALASEGMDPAAQARLLASVESSYKAPFPEPTDESLAGGLANTIAGRICNYFDLHGGGYTVDGACSSSLLAVCTACAALLDGELDVVLAGGVDLSLDPFELTGFARMGALATDDMRVYDEHPTGFLPGEGCGMVALMREDAAVAAGLTPWAVIRGWGISSDGSGGLTRPEVNGQLLALRRAYQRAGFGPWTVPLFEGHGTGTEVGDEVELEALIAAQDGRSRDVPAALGSIKANIGHTKAAAGIAGLLKAVLAVRHHVIPPTTGCISPHKLLTTAGSPLQVTEARPWPSAPLRAGVNAMGFGGINTHVVIEGAIRSRAAAMRLPARPLSHEVFAFGAPTAGQMAAMLARVAEIAPAMSFAEHGDLAAALAGGMPSDGMPADAGGSRAGSRVQPLRLALVSGDPGQLAHRAQQALDLLGKLEQAPEGTLISGAGVFASRGQALGVGLLFPGQGAPVRSAAGALGQIFPGADAYFPGTGQPSGHPAAAESVPAAAPSAVDTAQAQPAILRACLAGMHWLNRLGVRARAAVGHSLGEITALCWAGVLSEDDAIHLATERGRLMGELGAQETGMASVTASAGTTRELLAGTKLVIAADNGVTQAVAGPLADIGLVLERAWQHGIAAQRLNVSHAFHSPAVATAAPGLAACLSRLQMSGPARTVYSTISGRRLALSDDVPDLLVTQLTAPVLFRQAVEQLAEDCAVLVEVGPGHGLTSLVPGITAVPAVSLDTGTESAEAVCRVTAALFAAGATAGLPQLFAHRIRRPFDLWRDFEFLANPCESAPLPVHAVPPEGASEADKPVLVGDGAVQTADSRSADSKPANSRPANSQGADEAVLAGDSAMQTADSRPADSKPANSQPANSQVADVTVADVAGLVKDLVAEVLELPVEVVQGTDRLLGDLHLSSLQVGQLAVRAAERCGRLTPAAPLSLADASVADLATVVETLPLASEHDAMASPPGSADWHRLLVAYTVPVDVGDRAEVGDRTGVGDRAVAGQPVRSGAVMEQPRCWTILGHGSLRPTVTDLLPTRPDAPPAMLFFVPEDPDDAVTRSLINAVRRAVAEDIPLTVVDEADTVSGFLATVSQEHPDTALLLVRIQGRGGAFSTRNTTAAAAVAGQAAAPPRSGFREVVVDADGHPAVVRYRPLELSAGGELPLGSGDVVLVTGGGRGIGFETALTLGRRSGARVALLGRGDPERDGELRDNLARLSAAGVTFRYEQADVSDAAAVSAATGRITTALGPVVALIHASGVNAPGRFAGLTNDDFAGHAGPKVHGLRTVLGALDTGRLKVLVTYGSVIGRFGLAGEAHYALANGRMRELARTIAARLPGCWVCNIDWTAWSGAGMGSRLDVLDQLLRSGMTPLPVDRGVELLLALLAARPASDTVVATGRLPQLDETGTPGAPSPGFRFAQRTILRMAGVELITEADLSLTGDPYLADHRIDGMPVLPAVYALEAMAQAAELLTGEPAGSIGNGRFDRPVIVPADGTRTIRVCALLREDGDVDVVLRSDETRFAIDHFSGRVTTRAGQAPEVPARRSAVFGHRAAQLYGPLFFHGPAFQLLRRYEHLEATGCTAVLAVGHPVAAPWPGPPRLGDPARNDASIHVLQACVPHRRLLPVGCDRFTVHQHPGAAAGDLVLAATEREHSGVSYRYDVVVRDAAGDPVVSWTGLQLRDVGPIEAPGGWSHLLLGPYLQRGASALLPTIPLQLSVASAGPRAADRSQWVPPDPGPSGGIKHSRSHLDGAVLEVSAPTSVACDWEYVAGPDRLPDLRRLIPWADQSDQLARLTGEPEEQVLARLWTIRECLWKTGRTAPGPLVIQGAYEQGWVLLRAGSDDIASAVLHIDGEPAPVAVAVLARERPCDATSSTATS